MVLRQLADHNITLVWRTSTPEPIPDGIIWTYIKDVTRYIPLFADSGTLILELDNLLETGLNGIYSSEYVPTGDIASAADSVLSGSWGNFLWIFFDYSSRSEGKRHHSYISCKWHHRCFSRRVSFSCILSKLFCDIQHGSAEHRNNRPMSLFLKIRLQLTQVRRCVHGASQDLLPFNQNRDLRIWKWRWRILVLQCSERIPWWLAVRCLSILGAGLGLMLKLQFRRFYFWRWPLPGSEIAGKSPMRELNSMPLIIPIDRWLGRWDGVSILFLDVRFYSHTLQVPIPCNLHRRNRKNLSVVEFPPLNILQSPPAWQPITS